MKENLVSDKKVKWGVRVPLFDDGTVWVTRSEGGIIHIISYDKYEDAVEASKIWNKSIVDVIPPPLADKTTQKPDMEMDLYRSKHLCKKVQNEVYAQALYAAMCNNVFEKEGTEWSVSWRTAGDIVAKMVGKGCYLDYYCSGMMNDDYRTDEGTVTPEIKQDLESLGWRVTLTEQAS